MRIRPYWFSGTAIALAGVAVHRLLAPLASGAAKSALLLAGMTLAFGGLLVIVFGLNRSHRR
ncbi:MAG: hypothetical protein WC789_11745 [Lentisphaeria bacterium]|jgi:hypothetical protein